MLQERQTLEERQASMAQEGLKILHRYMDHREMTDIMSKSLGRKVTAKTRDADFGAPTAINRTGGNFKANAKPVKASRPFTQPSRTPIQIPAQFANDRQKSRMFRLAVHELGHALSNLLFCGGVDGVLLTAIDGGGCGMSYGLNGSGEDGCRMNLAGLAAERLVAGDPLPVEGFQKDIERAQQDLRSIATLEVEIGPRMVEIYASLQDTFATSWTAALSEGATQLTRRGVLSGKALFEIFNDSQKKAADMGGLTFAKSFQHTSIGFGNGAPHQDIVMFPKAVLFVRKEIK